MNKQELVAVAAKEAGVTEDEATCLLDAILKGIVRSVANDQSVVLHGFGEFRAHNRVARTGKNPRTGEALEITEKRLPRFQAGTAFKVAVANNKPFKSKAVA